MTGRLTATVHDASRCTVDGRPCWIAAVEVDGRFQPTVTGLFGSTAEASTVVEALDLAEGLLRTRGVDPAGRVRVARRG